MGNSIINPMKGFIGIGFFVLFMGGVACADHHEPPPPQTLYGQSYSLVVSDPAALIEAMQSYRASETGQKMGSNVALSQNIANGDLASTHTINVFYPSIEAMSAAIALQNSSADTAAFRRTISQIVTGESDNVFTVLRATNREGAVTSESPVTMLFGLEVTDQAAFMSAFDGIWNSQAAADFPGNMFFGQVLAMGQNESTHWVSFQANDLQTLLTGMEAFMGSDDFARYGANAGSFRRVTNRSISQTVLQLLPPGAE
jgi:hypothetical protein